MNNKKRIIKYSILLIIILGITGGSFAFYKSSQKPEEKYLYQESIIGNLEQTVSATGTVLPASKISLSFKSSGTLKTVPFKVNDQVKQGDLLGQLDNVDLELQVAQAQADLRRERANLKKLLAGATSEAVSVALEEVNNAKLAHETAKNTLVNLEKQYVSTIERFKQDIKTAEDKWADSKEEKTVLIQKQEKELDQLKQTAIINLQTAYYTAFSVRDAIIQIRDNDKMSPDNLTLGNYTEYEIMLTQLTALTQEYSNLLFIEEISTPLETVFLTISSYKSHYLKLDDTITRFLKVLTELIPSGELTTTDVEAFKTALVANQKTVGTQKTSLNTSQSSLINTQQLHLQQLTTQNSLITSAENAFDTSKSLLNQEISKQERSIQETKDNIQSAKSTQELIEKRLKQIEAPAKDYEIELQQAVIDKQIAVLNATQNNLSNAQVIAPIEGIIVSMPFDIGEKINTSDIAFVIESPKQFEVKIDIPESDISKIKVGDKAQLTFDAYGEDTTIETQISEIEPSETVIQDITYYKVTLPLPETEVSIKSGLSVDATIFTAFKDNTLLVPNRAVLIDDTSKKYVRILENNSTGAEVIIKYVETGLKGDGGLIEILSGLNEGENVVTLIKDED